MPHLPRRSTLESPIELLEQPGWVEQRDEEEAFVPHHGLADNIRGLDLSARAAISAARAAATAAATYAGRGGRAASAAGIPPAYGMRAFVWNRRRKQVNDSAAAAAARRLVVVCVFAVCAAR